MNSLTEREKILRKRVIIDSSQPLSEEQSRHTRENYA